MLRLHQKERDQFQHLFTQEKKEKSDELLRLLEAFLSTEEHVSIDDLYDLYRANGGSEDRGFVQHAADIMVKYGFAHKVALEGKPVSYEHRHLGNHHDHLVCVKCGKIEEFYLPEMELLQDQIAARRGFQTLQHKMEIYGLCSKCSSGRPQLTSLSMTSPGDKVVIDHIRGDKGVQFRLSAMGLQPGQAIQLISNNGGPVVVARGDSRLAVGRGLSEKVMVRRRS
jgi:Fur family transcriptional regulator, ferric uptake regulator